MGIGTSSWEHRDLSSFKPVLSDHCARVGFRIRKAHINVDGVRERRDEARERVARPRRELEHRRGVHALSATDFRKVRPAVRCGRGPAVELAKRKHETTD